MNHLKQLLLILGCIVCGLTIVRAQDKAPVKFGKISPADFNVTAPSSDSGAAALVIADIGESTFEGNTKGWFTLEYTRYRRMKILSKNGFDVATVKIPLYTSGSSSNGEEKIISLKAVTYNLENGKVVETRLDDKAIFTDKISKNWFERKFTFPAIKEGSIIEYSYTQTSDFLFNLQPWEFQGEYPCLWSEYQVAMPDFFQYVTLTQGAFLPDVNTRDSRQVTFSVTVPGGAGRDDKVSFEDNVVRHRWVMKNVPPLKEERYTTTLNNYIAKIEFQLSRYSFPNSMPEDKMGNWATVGEKLMKSDDFGGDLASGNGWMDEDMKMILKDATGRLEKAQKIYAWVRDNFTCTNRYGFYLTNPLKTIYKNRNGNAAELNLLLAAMLLHANIPSDPVILSTRAHGFTHQLYPLLSRYNYVICRARIDSAAYYLDASDPWIGFGHIPERCYNGHARVITKEMATPVYFYADSIRESKTTIAFVTNDEKGKLNAHIKEDPGYIESCEVREKIHDKGEKDFFKAIQTAYTGETTIANPEIDSLKMRDLPVEIAYDVKLNIDSNEDLLYFNPMMAEGYKENPFAAAERKYPVEMSYAMDETYVLNMELPDGYKVDELPKSAKVTFNDNEGFFEYLIAADENGIQFRSRIKLTKANYKPEDYATLRDFFAFIVKKQSEQIVFKKKK